MSDNKELDYLTVESPLHQLKQLEEAVNETGTGLLVVMGVEEFADEFAGLTRAEIVEKVGDMRRIPEISMAGARPEDALPIAPLFVFVDQSIADCLTVIGIDEEEEQHED